MIIQTNKKYIEHIRLVLDIPKSMWKVMIAGQVRLPPKCDLWFCLIKNRKMAISTFRIVLLEFIFEIHFNLVCLYTSCIPKQSGLNLNIVCSKTKNHNGKHTNFENIYIEFQFFEAIKNIYLELIIKIA